MGHANQGEQAWRHVHGGSHSPAPAWRTRANEFTWSTSRPMRREELYDELLGLGNDPRDTSEAFMPADYPSEKKTATRWAWSWD